MALDFSAQRARLVERDEGVFEGAGSEDVAHPLRLQALSRTTELSFDLRLLACLARVRRRTSPDDPQATP